MDAISMKRFARAAVIALAAAVAPAQAQYPERVVKLVVPFPAGSANDLVGRAVTDRLAKIGRAHV